jgi:flagellar motor protein MotB
MTEEELQEELIAEKVYKRAQLEEELAKLGKSWSTGYSLVMTLAMPIIIALSVAFPDIVNENFNLVLLGFIVLSALSARLELTNQRLNRRIDIMYKLLKPKS